MNSKIKIIDAIAKIRVKGKKVVATAKKMQQLMELLGKNLLIRGLLEVGKSQKVQGVPHLCYFHYCGSNYRGFWLIYAQVGDFALVGDPLQ